MRIGEQAVPRRGRPSRHESEKMRTIAWFHFVAGDAAIDRVASLPQLCNLDQATIYRYRTGEISPRAALLNDPDEWFRAARVVYDVGPFNVALWDAMWGELTSTDGILAARLTPRGEWANEGFSAFLFDDELLGNIVSFRQAVVREDAVARDLFAFATAIRIFRVNVANGTGAKPAMKELLQSGLALPGARGLLTRFGLLDAMREWVRDITKGIPNRRHFSDEPRLWMEDEYLFQELCSEADRRLAEFRRAIFGGPLVTH